MACFVNAVAMLIFSILGVVRSQVKVEKDDNIEPFALLCRIYDVAKNPPINHVEEQEPAQIVQEINALNGSLMEPKFLNETERVGNNWEATLTSAVTKQTALAQLSLNQITQKAHKILEDIRKMNVTEQIKKLKAELHKVIFGEGDDASDLFRETVKDVGNRSKACGDTGLSSKGASAGKNLVVDFFCLCVQRPDGEGANQVCGFYAGSGYENGQLGWNETGSMGSSTMWASIKGGCGKYMHQHPKSTAEARHILDQFLKHLKTGGVYRQIKCEKDHHSCKKDIFIESSDKKQGMLGTGVTLSGGREVTCDGKEGGKKGNSGGLSPGGVCVYYGPESESWEKNIIWMKQLRTALASVDAANNQTATIQRNIKKLQMLLNRAEEIYETTKVTSEIQKPEGLATFQNATTKQLTAYNATRTRSYSYSLHRYFIPELILFLL